MSNRGRDSILRGKSQEEEEEGQIGKEGRGCEEARTEGRKVAREGGREEET